MIIIVFMSTLPIQVILIIYLCCFYRWWEAMVAERLSDREDLVEDLDSEPVCDYLLQHGVITKETYDDISQEEHPERNRALLRHLDTLHSTNAMALFINALRQSGQLDLASSLDFTKRIKPVHGTGKFSQYSFWNFSPFHNIGYNTFLYICYTIWCLNTVCVLMSLQNLELFPNQLRHIVAQNTKHNVFVIHFYYSVHHLALSVLQSNWLKWKWQHPWEIVSIFYSHVSISKVIKSNFHKSHLDTVFFIKRMEEFLRNMMACCKWLLLILFLSLKLLSKGKWVSLVFLMSFIAALL